MLSKNNKIRKAVGGGSKTRFEGCVAVQIIFDNEEDYHEFDMSGSFNEALLKGEKSLSFKRIFAAFNSEYFPNGKPTSLDPSYLAKLYSVDCGITHILSLFFQIRYEHIYKIAVAEITEDQRMNWRRYDPMTGVLLLGWEQKTISNRKALRVDHVWYSRVTINVIRRQKQAPPSQPTDPNAAIIEKLKTMKMNKEKGMMLYNAVRCYIMPCDAI